MANKYTKKQTNAKINVDFSAFGGGKKPSKKNQKKAVKNVKSLGFKGILIVLLFLIIGAGVGVGALFIVSKNDCFEINGKDEIELVPNCVDADNNKYVDEGCKVIAFGKDISREVIVETNMMRADDGSYYAIENGDYFIKYTTQDLKYGKLFIVEKYRIVHVQDNKDEGEDVNET